MLYPTEPYGRNYKKLTGEIRRRKCVVGNSVPFTIQERF